MKGKMHPTEKLGRTPKTAFTDSKSVNKPHNSKTKTLTIGEFFSRIKVLLSQFYRRFNTLNRNTKLAVLLSFILVFVALFALILSSGEKRNNLASEQTPSSIEQTEAKTARISIKEGTLQTKSNNGTWEDVTDNLEVSEDSSLRTIGATSRAVIVFEDKSELRLDANSEVELLTITDARVVIKHISGYTFNRVTESSERTYVVESIDARYEAIGTAFKTVANGDEQSVDVIEGTVLETSTNKRPVEGEKLIVENRSRPSESNTVKKLDIEVLKKDLFIQWNREIELANNLFKNKLGFMKDFDAPSVTISSPAENETILLDAEATDGTIEIKGVIERGATLTVQSRSQLNSQPITVNVNDSGEFTTPVLTAALGNSVFLFTVKDKVGNIAEKSVRYNFQRKSAPINIGSLSLIGKQVGDKAELSWTTKGDLKTPDGVKVVYSQTQTPTYNGENTKSKLESGNSSTIKDLESGITYYFRVCVYDADEKSCDEYSNQVSLDIH